MEFIIILLLLILNGIFAMYEIALVSSSKARLETLVGKGNKRAKGVLKQLEEPEKFPTNHRYPNTYQSHINQNKTSCDIFLPVEETYPTNQQKACGQAAAHRARCLTSASKGK